MSSDFFGFDNSFLNETFSQDHLFFQTWQDFQDDLLNNYENIPSLSELGDADYSVFELENEYYKPSFGRFPTFSCSDETAAKFDSHSYYENQQSVSLKPYFDCVSESENRFLPSPESSSFSSGDVRSFCSYGDSLHKEIRSMQGSSANLKVGRYSVEERKVRIDRYRAKRARRNFNKNITYACRKTLADGRPRVRGRFVSNKVGEIFKASSLFQR